MKPHKQANLFRTGRAFGALMVLGAMATCSADGISQSSITEPALLEPEHAFQLSAIRKDPKNMELRYQIADGYYMYRGRFKFALEHAQSVKLGKAVYSKGKMKQDPTFGRVEVYRDSVRILLPIVGAGKHTTSANAMPLRLKVTSQGCADVGVCYPPLHQFLTLGPASLDVVRPETQADADGTSAASHSASKPASPSLAEKLLKTK